MATRVRFGAQMMGRLGRLIGRLRALRSRREGRGVQRSGGAGDEFAGHRPWQPGEDARHLDWELLARLDQPFVRAFEREVSERWAVLLDVSDSMDMGGRSQTKLQLAAEVALGLAALALEARASLALATSDGRRFEVQRTPDQGGLMEFLRATEPCDVGLAGQLGALLDGVSRRERPGRVFVVGDLDGVAHEEVRALDGPGRELVVLRVLAHAELVPSEALFAEDAHAIELEDMESFETLAATRTTARAYERLLARDLDRWRHRCARHRIRFELVEADRGHTFEDVLDELVMGGYG